MNSVCDEKELAELGLTAAAEQVKKDRRLAWQLRTAFEHFRFVTPEGIKKFNSDLQLNTKYEKGRNQWGAILQYDQLGFCPLGQYQAVPPKEALADLRKAKELDCFDDFEVATIVSVEKIPDPIIFGRIKGTDNRYFITQWGDDVKIEQILKEDEG